MAETEGKASDVIRKFEFTKNNLINFSDAVFAIAITLLVIDIKLPEGLAGGACPSLLSALVDLWPNFLSYVISFIVIAVYWFNYHEIMFYATEADKTMARLNIVFLFFVTIIPFPASVIGRYGDQSIAVALYAASLALGSTALFLLWQHVLRKYLVAEHALSKKQVDYLSAHALFPIVVALVSMMLSFFSPFIAEIFLFLILISVTLKGLFRLAD